MNKIKATKAGSGPLAGSSAVVAEAKAPTQPDDKFAAIQKGAAAREAAVRENPPEVPQGVKVPGMVNTGYGMIRERAETDTPLQRELRGRETPEKRTDPKTCTTHRLVGADSAPALEVADLPEADKTVGDPPPEASETSLLDGLAMMLAENKRLRERVRELEARLSRVRSAVMP